MNHPIEISYPWSGSRKKLWDISSDYHCSIVGTCLTLEEAGKILLKAGFPVTRDTTDYAIHGVAVSSASKKNWVSKIIQKTLEAKYKRDINEYSKILNPVDLQSAFKHDLEEGNIPGSYWAVMSHPFSTKEILQEAFCEVHMLSHLNGASKAGNIQRVTFLESKVEKLEEEKKYYKKHIKSLEKKIEDMKSLVDTVKIKDNAITQYQKEVEDLKNEGTMSRLFDELFIVVNQYETEKHMRVKSEDSHKQLENEYKGLNRKYSVLKQENEILNKEIYFIEKELLTFNNDTSECRHYTNSRCQCRPIEGKSILYVGGKASAIGHCRVIVEKKGGIFLHHDGGLENNFSMLNKIIGKADAVFCPLDCISHNACQQIKKICKQSNKELKLLRSSGVSTFTRELHETFRTPHHEEHTRLQ